MFWIYFFYYLKFSTQDNNISYLIQNNQKEIELPIQLDIYFNNETANIIDGILDNKINISLLDNSNDNNLNKLSSIITNLINNDTNYDKEDIKNKTYELLFLEKELASGYAKASKTYYYDNITDFPCKNILLIQVETWNIEENNEVFPNRELLVIDCLNQLDCYKAFGNISGYDINITESNYHSCYINGNNLISNTIFNITTESNNTYLVKIKHEHENPLFIISYNRWLNMPNEKAKNVNFPSGIFSYKNPDREIEARKYAKTLPNTEVFFLDYIPMVPIDDNLNCSSNYLDFEWCTSKIQCNNSVYPFEKPKGYGFSAPHYDNDIQDSIVEIFKNILHKTPYKSHFNNPNIINGAKVVTNEKVGYQTGIFTTGYFAVSSKQAYVETNQDSPKNRHVLAEISHELGHVYDLADYHGADNKNEKIRPHQFRDYRIIVPYRSDNAIKNSAMNGPDNSDNEYAYAFFNKKEYLDLHRNRTLIVDKRIKVYPNKPDVESVIIQLIKDGKQLVINRINAIIPRICIDENPNYKIGIYYNNVYLKQYNCYLDKNTIIILNNQDDYISYKGTFKIFNKDTLITKTFGRRYDTEIMPYAISAYNTKYEYNDEKEINTKTRYINIYSEISTKLYNNSTYAKSFFPKYENVTIELYDGCWIKHILVDILFPENHCIKIENRAGYSTTVDLLKNDTFIVYFELKKNQEYSYCN